MAALAALPWVTRELREDLLAWRKSPSWRRVSGPYGLLPFRLEPKPEWQGTDLIGIDLGSFAVSLANHRNKTVTALWMRHPVAREALRRLGYIRGKQGQ